MHLESTAFDPGGQIPFVYTCDGEDRSPPLRWTGVPPDCRSLALIIDDPDAPDPKAPKRTWVHWVLFDIPPDVGGLPEGVQRLPFATREGKNDWGRVGYRGPCPPIGEHRYVHKLFALDVTLGDQLLRPNAQQLGAAMQGHVLAKAELIGTYARRRR